MSGIPTRERGATQPVIYKRTMTTRVESPGQNSRGQRYPLRSATTLGCSPSKEPATASNVLAPSGIPTRTGIPAPCTSIPAQRQGPGPGTLRSNLKPPSQSRIPERSNVSRSAIPTASMRSFATTQNVQGQTDPRPVPQPSVSGMKLRTHNPSLGAIPKARSRSVIQKEESRHGRTLMSKTISQTITEGKPNQEEFYQTGSGAQRIIEKQKSFANAMRKGGSSTFSFKKNRNSEASIQSFQSFNDENVAGTNSKQQEAQEWNEAQATISKLEKELEASLLGEAACKPKTPLIGTASRKTAVSPPIIMTNKGPIPVRTQVISTKSVTKQPGKPDIIGRDVTTFETVSPDVAERTQVILSRLSPRNKGAPSPKRKEAVVVQKKVAIAPGYKQTIKTVTYEGDPTDIRKVSVLPSPQEIARMVREETAIINETLTLNMPDVKRVSPNTYPLRKKALEYSLENKIEKLESHKLCVSCVNTPEDIEEATPEIIAEMMNTEERGLTMSDNPANVYNYLFSAEASAAQQNITVSSAAAYPLHDVVIPTQVPNMSMDTANAEEIIDVTMQAAESATSSNVKDASYVAIVGDKPLQSLNTARKGNKTKRKRVTLLEKEPPPWGAIEDVASVIDVIGAPLAETRVVQEEAEEIVDPMVEGIEYLLQMQAPQHYSQVQMRGSQKPDWFPGYVMAFPNLPNLIGVAKSPSEVFANAWKATQPDIFNDDNVFII